MLPLMPLEIVDVSPFGSRSSQLIEVEMLLQTPGLGPESVHQPQLLRVTSEPLYHLEMCLV